MAKNINIFFFSFFFAARPAFLLTYYLLLWQLQNEYHKYQSFVPTAEKLCYKFIDKTATGQPRNYDINSIMEHCSAG